MELLANTVVQNKQAALGVAVALLGVGLAYRYMRRQPKKLTQVGVVSKLLLHPLKSGKAVTVEAAECLLMGLRCGELYDR